MKRKKWTNNKFVTTHPSGTLATALIQVKEIMAKKKEIPLISANQTMRAALAEMTKKRLGIVCVKEKNGKINLITDGDIEDVIAIIFIRKKFYKYAVKIQLGFLILPLLLQQ